MASMSCNGIPAPIEVSLFSTISYSVLSILTTIGNSCIVFVVYKDPFKKLKTPFMYFVVNLAIADLIVGCVFSPVGVYVHSSEAMGTLNETAVKVLHISFFMSATASILSLIALTIDRYIVITFPLKYLKYLTWKRCVIITGVICFISLTFPFGYLKVGFIDYLVVDAFASMFLSFIIFIFTYIRIYKFLRKQTRSLAKHIKATAEESEEFQLQRLKQEKKVTRVFLWVLFLFLLTYGPASAMILTLKFCPHCDCYFRHWLRDLTLVFISVNSLMNPFIYTVRLKTFRKSLVYLTKKYRGKVRSDTFESDDQRKLRAASKMSASINTQSSFVSYLPDDQTVEPPYRK